MRVAVAVLLALTPVTVAAQARRGVSHRWIRHAAEWAVEEGGLPVATLAIEHDDVRWRDGWLDRLRHAPGKRFALGQWSWAVLRCDVPFSIGDEELPAGRYDLALELEDDGTSIDLVLLEAGEITSLRIHPADLQRAGFQVELERSHDPDPHAARPLAIELEGTGHDPNAPTLSVLFGPHRLRAQVVLAAPAQMPSRHGYRLPDAVEALFGAAQRAQLWRLGPEQPHPTGETFEGYPVLATSHLDSADAVAAMLAVVRRGVHESDGSTADCFEPEMGARIYTKTGSFDLLISISCSGMVVRRAGAEPEGAPMSGIVAAPLRAIFPAALSPGPPTRTRPARRGHC